MYGFFLINPLFNLMKRSILIPALGAIILVGAGCIAGQFGQSTGEFGPALFAAQAAKDKDLTPAAKAPGKFIVVFKDDVTDADIAEQDLVKKHGLGPKQSYRHAFKGFAADVPEGQLDKIKADSRVAFVSEDGLVQALVMPNATAKAAPPATQPPQSVPTGVSRIQATVNANKGAGIGVAVIDTGIDLTHPDLAANIVANVNCVNSKKTGQDDNGHGSHVAGTIAAVSNTIGVIGVAPGAKLIAVKALDNNGSGSWSSIICGLDWVTANAAKYDIKVANLSLGGGGSSDNNCGNTNKDALHKAICRARDAGVTIVVAAGNSAANASASVPAAYDDAVITVSALADSNGQPGGTGAKTPYGPDDTFATFSNYGTAVDIAGPGVSILSTWLSGGYNTISGTSMATPHVAGGAALYIKSHPGSTWTQVRDALKAAGELLGSGHTDPSGKHPEPVLRANAL